MSAALLPAVVLTPLAGAVLTGLAPPPRRVVAALLVGGLTTLLTGLAVAGAGSAGRYPLGGWAAPLGIELTLDALSAVFLALTGAVTFVVFIFASATPAVRGSEAFWPLALMLWAGLNAVYLTADLFNAYVALELMGLAAVALVAIGGRAAWAPALRYLFIAVLGSLVYLVGVSLIYARTGTLDMALAGERLAGGQVALSALVLMTAAMALKTALFPLHPWLPAAHASAPSAVSPLLSALVIKASLYLLIRVWFTVFGGQVPIALPMLLGVLGALGLVWGTAAALRRRGLKQIVAYSTVAQVGYFFLLFPLLTPAVWAPADPWGLATEAARAGWTGALVLALSHGLAKAAMFLSAGVLALAYDGDEIAGFEGAVSRLPGTVLTFAIAGVALAGLPPTFAFTGKWQLLQAALGSGQWWWVVMILAGSLLTFGYTARVVRATFNQPGERNLPRVSTPPRRMTAAAFVLAVTAVVMGLAATPVMTLLDGANPIGVSG
ncbi:MAG TPA: proton-conducting transporter membrane subunit [Beutenbergiaceae bacterium]|nr:proton-conducting transporter membrane subunit [Beutenbergiaceae bacterium]